MLLLSYRSKMSMWLLSSSRFRFSMEQVLKIVQRQSQEHSMDVSVVSMLNSFIDLTSGVKLKKIVGGCRSLNLPTKNENTIISSKFETE